MSPTTPNVTARSTMRPIILLKQDMEIGVRSFFQRIDIPAPAVPLKKSVLNPYLGRIMDLKDCAKSKKVAVTYARKHRQS